MNKPLSLSPLCLGILLATAASQSSAASFEFMDGEVSGSINTTLSAGVSVSTQDPKKNLYTYGESKGLDDITPGKGTGVNADNGRLNYRKGDVISNQYKGLTELALDYKNYGFKGSVKYWYDHWLETKSGRYTEFDDTGFDDLAGFSGVELLDAYGWTYFDVGEVPVDVRLGKQVISWGEGMFLQGGINVINPVDAAAFNRPGVELKEGLLPVEALYTSMGLTPEVTLEAFYQMNWRPTVLDGCSTFFATTDAIQPGCEGIYTQANKSNAEEEALGRSVIDRTADELPGDSGQWGVSFKYYAEALNGTEFGLYAMNYHSRLPFVNAVNADWSGISGVPSGDVDFPINITPGGPSPTIRFVEGATYNAAFPEDIKLYGLSFNTSLDSGWSISGELSYRPDMPQQININDLLGKAAASRDGESVQGFVTKPVTQLQISLLNSFPQVLGASELSLAGEIGYVHIADLDDGNRYGRSAMFGPGAGSSACAAPKPNVTTEFCTNEGYTTANSWGYRLRAALAYSGIIPGVLLKPSLSFRHDVDGYSYESGGSFMEGQMASTLGLSATYQNNYTANIAYTGFFGNNKYSTLDDRDFVSFSVSASF
ncbi:DUF1302 domain-containing protein [uncultured Endozoicomonas sp.]|uniref:DUF1302 domain-containing protein n=1 Tax=uncultured Endozoicomonas sp. TaxID=432652 RepID=UPI00261853C2|nr:DUF1302 domain-containing protein [uncultured Endozoicomonas sp.]